MSKAGKLIGCCGVIVFSPDQSQVVMVETPKGNLGFPKGKRHQSETDLECAFRELQEETGLSPDQIDLVDGLVVDELSRKGNPNIRYFVGYLRGEENSIGGKSGKWRQMTFQFDPTELKAVSWQLVAEVEELEKLKDARKIVLQQVLKELRSL